MYLQGDGFVLFGTLHEPEHRSSGTAVLICPPFGWDALSAHRSLRAFAGSLAAAGHVVLRIDLPGAGDSSGTPRDPGLVETWGAAVDQAASWLHTRQGCERVVAFGIGLGGMLATQAMLRGSAIDELVLWGAHSRGGLLLRELRAFSALIHAEHEPVPGFVPPAGEVDYLEIGGFVLSAESVAALEAIDLASETLPELSGRRVLMLGRDGIRPDRGLRELLERSGAHVTVADGAGFGGMMRPPQFAKRPDATIASAVAWITAGNPGHRPVAPASTTGAASLVALESTELSVDGNVIVERPFDMEFGGQRLTGVLAEPRDAPRSQAPLTALLLNAGAIRRIGPNRMWVEAARRWASRGIPTLRIDLIHLGDADGDERHYTSNKEFYRPEVREQVAAMFDELEALGLPDRFLVGGLCSGANHAFHAGFSDPRVRAIVLINLWAFFWTEELAASRDRRNAQRLLRNRSLRPIVRIAMGRGQIGRIAGLRAALASVRPDFGRLYTDRVGDALDGLEAREVETLLLFSHNEPLYDDYFAKDWSTRLDRWPVVTLDRIPIRDHMFRPCWAQKHVSTQLDAAMQRALARVGSTVTLAPETATNRGLPL